MKAVFAFVVVAIVASMLMDAYDASVAREIQKGKCGNCVYNGKQYAQGAIWQEKGKCQQFRCGPLNETHVEIIYEYCGAVAAGPGYVLDNGNPNLPYPDCCRKPVPVYQKPPVPENPKPPVPEDQKPKYHHHQNHHNNA